MHGHGHASHRTVEIDPRASHGIAELVASAAIVSEIVCEVMLLLLLLVSRALIHSAEVPLLLLLLHLHELLLLLLGVEPGSTEALVSHKPLLTVHLAHLTAVPIGSPVATILLLVAERRVHAGIAAVHGAAPVGELPLPHHLLLLEVHHLVVHRTDRLRLHLLRTAPSLLPLLVRLGAVHVSIRTTHRVRRGLGEGSRCGGMWGVQPLVRELALRWVRLLSADRSLHQALLHVLLSLLHLLLLLMLLLLLLLMLRLLLLLLLWERLLLCMHLLLRLRML